MKKELGMKARVFIKYITSVEFGSKKAGNAGKLVDEVMEELFAANPDKYFEMVTDTMESLRTWAARCKVIDEAFDLVGEARTWLVENGYLWKYTKENCGVHGTMTKTWYGVTAKGWAVAPKYLALLK